MAIVLSDDGTMDTVLRCTECGEEFRFNYDAEGPQERLEFVYRDCLYVIDPAGPVFTAENLARFGDDEAMPCQSALAQQVWDAANQADYDAWIDHCIEEVTAEHACPLGEGAFDDEP